MEHMENKEIANPNISKSGSNNLLITSKTFLTIGEAAYYTGFSVKYIYQLVHNRIIPYYKPGRKLFFKASELDAWISKSKMKSIQEIEEEAFDSLN